LIRELAVYAVVRKFTLSRALDGLEKDGLIMRKANRDDGSAFHVFLTGAGHAAHTRLWHHMAKASEVMCNCPACWVEEYGWYCQVQA